MEYVVVDMTRTEQWDTVMYWNKNNYGYSDDLKEAKKFTKEDAQEIVNKPYSDLVILSIENAEFISRLKVSAYANFTIKDIINKFKE